MLLDDFKIPGKRLLVKGNMEMRTEDIAGETSGTDVVEKGIKPKRYHPKDHLGQISCPSLDVPGHFNFWLVVALASCSTI